ncbi:invasin [Brachyspira intermedia PWS/A]|uniref:Invasin n=1 Tax=Brachyspira intermedia (strain ATCC 51140 / PWS/A) TaxID=1045858 RepID=G0EMV1_BRAIP|nr:invasin [Brachyspira intermedia]AEM22992.1 invasin [Brachyspira intermedia PWS/A]
MKKNYIIIFMFIFLFHSTQKLFSIIPEGLYITPKFAFAHNGNDAYIKDNGEKGYFNYLGGGFALGYSIPTINKSSPVRFEFEYLGRKLVSMSDDLQMHTLLGSVYFDLNFLLTKEKLTDEVYKQTMLTQYAPFTIYLGISIGSRINTGIPEELNGVKLQNSSSTLVFGFSGGMAFNVLPYMSIDIGYRYLLDTKAQGYHEVLAGLRFKVPKI